MRPQLKPHQLRPQDSTSDLANKDALGPLPMTNIDLMNGTQPATMEKLIPGIVFVLFQNKMVLVIMMH